MNKKLMLKRFSLEIGYVSFMRTSLAQFRRFFFHRMLVSICTVTKATALNRYHNRRCALETIYGESSWRLERSHALAGSVDLSPENGRRHRGSFTWSRGKVSTRRKRTSSQEDRKSVYQWEIQFWYYVSISKVIYVDTFLLCNHAWIFYHS